MTAADAPWPAPDAAAAAGPRAPALGPPRAEAGGAAALSALVRDVVAAGGAGGGGARQALHVSLAPLAPRLRRPGGGHDHARRLLREALEPVLRPTRARLFALPNGDLVAVAAPGQERQMEAVAASLGTLLAGVSARPPFALLRLPDQAAALLAALEDAFAPPRAPGGAADGDGGGAAPGDDPPAAPGAAEVAALERGLAAAGLAAYLRCRPVVRAAPDAAGGPPEPQWTEWRVALPELCASLLGEDAAAGGAPGGAEAPRRPPRPAWWRRAALPRHLRGLLDRRLLAELARPDEAAQRGPAGVSLGLAAIDSAEFGRFDAALGADGRARTVVGLDAAEILADPAGYAAARAVLVGRGYRLAVDAADPRALALLPPERAGAELARLRWSPAYVAPGAPPAPPLPPGRVVLTGVDRGAAMGWGWEAGITLFEGRLLRG